MYRKPLSYPRFFRKTSLALAIAATLALPAAFAAPGDPVGPEFRVNTTTVGAQRSSKLAVDADGDFVVTWTSPDGGGGQFDLGIFAQRYNRTGVRQGGEFRVNTTTAGGQFSPSVALDVDGDFVVAWNGNGIGDGSGIFAQRYNTAGVPQGGEFQVNTFTEGFQGAPDVALDADGDFIVAWFDDYQSSATDGIFAQRFNRAGIRQGGEFQVAGSGIEVDLTLPAVAMDSDGDFVVAWTSYYFDRSFSYGVFAQRYNSAGVPQGGSEVSSSGSSADVALDADGDFVVTWNSFQSNDSAPLDIFARRYKSSGVPQSGEFQVNTATAGDQQFPRVALDADGDFVVAWFGKGVGDGSGIFAQRYSNAGVPQGGEFRVNTTTGGSQSGPAIALDAGGDFVVAWNGNGAGDSSGIFAQRFAGPGAGVICDGRATTLVGTNGPDTLIGTSGDDVIAGLDGDDVIHGRGGNDRLCGDTGWDRLLGGFGNDRLIGGPGIDTAEFGGNAGVGASLVNGTAGGEGSDTLIGIENLTGTAFSDYLVGNGGPNILRGAGGSDILRGLGGNDWLFGGSANDNLDGGSGTDVCDGQGGTSDQATNCETVRNVP